MTVAELIAELGRYPGYLPVYSALDGADYEMCDTKGEPFTVNLTRELDCLAVERVVYEGTRLEIVGAWTPGRDELPDDTPPHVRRLNAAAARGWNPAECSLSFFEQMESAKESL
jgi:hypothetical protein